MSTAVELEHLTPELNTSVFIIPSAYCKNGLDRLVPLNDIALQVIGEVHHEHPVYVFPRADGQDKLYQMNNKSWKKARRQLRLPVRIHDLKHTFGRRLRAAGVSLEDRQDLLGHKSSRITTHYSPAEIQHLIEAANRVCQRQVSTPTVSALRERAGGVHGDGGNTFRQNSGKNFQDTEKPVESYDKFLIFMLLFGGPAEIRTRDQRIKRTRNDFSINVYILLSLSI